jgi:hypothetical protein
MIIGAPWTGDKNQVTNRVTVISGNKYFFIFYPSFLFQRHMGEKFSPYDRKVVWFKRASSFRI